MARPLVMGVLNVTPDSFSDGGLYFEPERAVERGIQMFDEGADVVDVGGESSRPGALPVPEAEEMRRVVPVIEALAAHGRVSVDTRKESVAEAALAAGATLLNDISASLWHVAAAAGAGWVAMHMKGTPLSMQEAPSYSDVVREVHGFLLERASRAQSAGVAEVWVDPGIGFGKTAAHNLSLLRHLPQLVATGFPVLVGTSRKSFLGALAARPGGPGSPPVPVELRVDGSIATATWAMLAGASMVRVHDVAASHQAAVLVGEARLDVSGRLGVSSVASAMGST
ncbi:MAG TPA: dihydropteroate synthase [Acidimicrobiales bacterium]|nr:dihydropteroate synthase [Acidimicrobiales bacterium]